MEKIETGEYVRTKEGFIYRIEDGEEFFEDSVDIGIGIIPDIEGKWVDKEHLNYIDKRDIKKHSKNLIDLIEVGDVIEIKECVSCFRNVEKIPIFDIGTLIAIKDGIAKYTMKIVSVLTHEQFEQNSYKVGGQDGV